MGDRKKDHIQLAFDSQTMGVDKDNRFIYEPMLSAHPEGKTKPFQFLGKQLETPIWASSMTGGTEWAGKINENIARVCNHFKMGMGLGSCRILLDNDTHFSDFNVRKFIGNDLPLYANLGIAQLEHIVEHGKTVKVNRLIDKLQANGLIIHVNPLQEWFQPEGNQVIKPPIETIERFLETFNGSVIIKEVGQGMGKDSLTKILQLPIDAIEFGAFGGTNFSMVEMLRANEVVREAFRPFAYIGQTAADMVSDINAIVNNQEVNCKQIIVSGGIKTFLDGYYLTQKCQLPAIYGMASSILKYAKNSYDELHAFIDTQRKGLSIANAYLKVND